MADTFLRVVGRDPLLFRDGKPFGTEPGALEARTLPLPLPGTLAGFVRTAIGDLEGGAWSAERAARVQQVPVAGPLLAWQGNTLFPAPADAVVYGLEKDPPGLMTLRPDPPPAGAGCDLPGRAALLPLPPARTEKADPSYRYWTVAQMLAWLASETGSGFPPPPQALSGPELDERTHVGIDASKGTGEDGRLFTTEALAFEHFRRGQGYAEWSLLARVGGEAPSPGLAPFGGERRLARLEAGDEWPRCDGRLRRKLERATLLRMVLATPALFAGGWRPGWLDEALEGAPPGFEGLRLRLAAAAVPRHLSVSGWDYHARGPKAVRWLVPAGAVYFFEVHGETAALAEQAWLAPVSDAEQDRRDGYGLALWGVWGGEETQTESDDERDEGEGAGGEDAVSARPDPGPHRDGPGSGDHRPADRAGEGDRVADRAREQRQGGAPRRPGAPKGRGRRR